MEVLRDGEFSLTLDTATLAKGLRPSKRAARNTQYLVVCVGAVAQDGVLQALDDISANWLNISATITDGFPYPQIFVFTNLIIVCGETKIYELVGGSLSAAKITVAAGSTWSAVDLYDYVYMSNSKVAVVRDPGSGVYSLSSTLPIASAICNYNGQILVGAPNEVV